MYYVIDIFDIKKATKAKNAKWPINTLANRSPKQLYRANQYDAI